MIKVITKIGCFCSKDLFVLFITFQRRTSSEIECASQKPTCLILSLLFFKTEIMSMWKIKEFILRSNKTTNGSSNLEHIDSKTKYSPMEEIASPTYICEASLCSWAGKSLYKSNLKTRPRIPTNAEAAWSGLRMLDQTQASIRSQSFAERFHWWIDEINLEYNNN